jgi:hypothetical protein
MSWLGFEERQGRNTRIEGDNIRIVRSELQMHTTQSSEGAALLE